MKKNQLKSTAGNLAKLTVIVALFYLIFQNIDFAKFVETLTKVKFTYFLMPCALYVVSLVIASVKLKWILMGYQMPIELGRAFDLNWIAGFFSNFLPTSIGGDVYRILYLNRTYPGKPAQVVSAVLLDRGLGVLVMLVVAGLTSIWFIDALVHVTWLIIVLYSAVILVILGSCFVLFFAHNLRLSHASRYTALNKIINGLNILAAYPDKRALTLALLVSFLYLALIIGSNYFLFLAFNSDISILILLFVIPVVNLAGLIPFSINGLGITEGVGILLFSHFGVEPELVLSILLAGRVLLILCSSTGGISFLFKRRTLPTVQQ